MTNYTKQTRSGIVREVALLHCDNVGATVEWERPTDSWLGKRLWSVGFHYTNASGRDYWGSVFATGTVEMYTRNNRTGYGRLVAAGHKRLERTGLSDTGRYLIQRERKDAATQTAHDAVQAESIAIVERANRTDTEVTDRLAGIKQVGTIDMTPSWTETARMLIVLMDNGTDEGKATARAEIQRMGTLLDRFIKQGAACA